MPLQKPVVVVALYEGPDHLSGLLKGFEVEQMDAFLLQRPHEALRDAVALRLAHVGGGGAEAETYDLGLELSRSVLPAPVVPQIEAQGDGLAKAAYSARVRASASKSRRLIWRVRSPR